MLQIFFVDGALTNGHLTGSGFVTRCLTWVIEQGNQTILFVVNTYHQALKKSDVLIINKACIGFGNGAKLLKRF